MSESTEEKPILSQDSRDRLLVEIIRMLLTSKAHVMGLHAMIAEVLIVLKNPQREVKSESLHQYAEALQASIDDYEETFPELFTILEKNPPPSGRY